MPLALPSSFSLVSSDGRRKLLAVDRYRIALFETDLDDQVGLSGASSGEMVR